MDLFIVLDAARYSILIPIVTILYCYRGPFSIRCVRCSESDVGDSEGAESRRGGQAKRARGFP